MLYLCLFYTLTTKCGVAIFEMVLLCLSVHLHFIWSVCFIFIEGGSSTLAQIFTATSQCTELVLLCVPGQSQGHTWRSRTFVWCMNHMLVTHLVIVWSVLLCHRFVQLMLVCFVLLQIGRNNDNIVLCFIKYYVYIPRKWSQLLYHDVALYLLAINKIPYNTSPTYVLFLLHCIIFCFFLMEYSLNTVNMQSYLRSMVVLWPMHVLEIQ